MELPRIWMMKYLKTYTEVSKQFKDKMVYLSKDKTKLILEFQFDYQTIALIKSKIQGRQWDSNSKNWTAPNTLANLEELSKMNFSFTAELAEKVYTHNKLRKERRFKRYADLPPLKRNLFDFQKRGVLFLEKRNGRALIGDEMGLGKTIQAIAWSYLHPEAKPFLIICPASLKYNWKREIENTIPYKVKVDILKGKKLYPLQKNSDYIIINYDILSSWVDKLKKIKLQAIITDEAHFYKNDKAARTKAVKKLAKGVKYFIALSGTPIVSRPIEFYNVLKLISPTLFPNRWHYAMRYCAAKNNGYGWDFSGASKTEELHRMISGVIMIRRKKQNVLKELPDKLWSYVPFELDNYNAYSKAKNDFINWLKEMKGNKAAERAEGAQTLVQLSYLKKLAIEGKLQQAVSWIKEFFESTDEKLVVFAIHKKVIDELLKTFSGMAVKVDGSLSSIQKQEAVQKFQNDSKVRLFIGNIQAAGVGITLTAASHIAFLELPWTPGEVVQAEDRCHRIGQKNTVNVYYLLADNTIDMDLAKLIDSKRKVVGAVLDGKKDFSESLFSELINKFLI